MTSTSYLAIDNSSVANFKAWGGAINTALDDAGWTRDYAYSSNQASPGTNFDWDDINAVPSAADSTYEIWIMGDALQATMPFFVRIDYWYDSGTFLRFTIGNARSTATILAGINGVTTEHFNAFVSNDFVMYDFEGLGRKHACFFSGSSSSFRMGLFLDVRSPSYSNASYFAFERSTDNCGDDTSDFVTFVAMNTNAGSQQFSIGNKRKGPIIDGLSLPYYRNMPAISGQNTPAIFPITPVYNGLELPLRYTMACRYEDVRVGLLTTQTATSYGVTNPHLQIVNDYTVDGIGSLNVAQVQLGFLSLWS